jgi:hypothetical protein
MLRDAGVQRCYGIVGDTLNPTKAAYGVCRAKIRARA